MSAPADHPEETRFEETRFGKTPFWETPVPGKPMARTSFSRFLPNGNALHNATGGADSDSSKKMSLQLPVVSL
jgi:hypothetical protein